MSKKYNILEIGFNFGHSSENFLKHSHANVLSLILEYTILQVF